MDGRAARQVVPREMRKLGLEHAAQSFQLVAHGFGCGWCWRSGRLELGERCLDLVGGQWGEGGFANLLHGVVECWLGDWGCVSHYRFARRLGNPVGVVS